jgi:drug/metabolite transporter (DMT)-like permease
VIRAVSAATADRVPVADANNANSNLHRRLRNLAIAISQSTMTFRRYLILGAVMIGASVGDTFLSAGMKQVGPVSLHHLLTLLVALKNPWIVSGIFFLILFFASYLTALSWADLTFVLPATGFGYVIIALLSKFWLGEIISAGRWVGIILITLGVGFVTNGPSYTNHDHPDPEDDDVTSANVRELTAVGNEDRSA